MISMSVTAITPKYTPLCLAITPSAPYSWHVRKTFKYRLYPTKKQQDLLDEQLAEACRLYNAALAERRYAWKMGKTSISYYEQQNQLKYIRAAGDVHLANFSSCQDVLRRVDKTFQDFFHRIKAGWKAGYPRFKSVTRFHSYTFPKYGDWLQAQSAEQALYPGSWGAQDKATPGSYRPHQNSHSDQTMWKVVCQFQCRD
jgi:hypothetical protein